VPPAPDFADKVKKVSGGSVDMRFFEPAALVPASQYFNAVATGSPDSAWTSLGFFAGKEIAFALFLSVPFDNVEVMLCGAITPGASGWPRVVDGETGAASLARALTWRNVANPIALHFHRFVGPKIDFNFHRWRQPFEPCWKFLFNSNFLEA
jgi:hypothetical protein